MRNKKTEYQVTIGYKAVLATTVKAESEEEAKKIALDRFEDYRHFGDKINIEDDSFNTYGIVNMDKTWNAL